MISLVPSIDPETEAADLGKLIHNSIGKKLFQNVIRRLNSRFVIYLTTCPASLIAPGLIVTPEIRRQSEIYLPIIEIRRVFYRLYRHVLTCPPVLSSTPFHNAMSWADLFVTLPPDFRFSANPALLLEALLSDQELMTKFLFHSFLPKRFYGGFGRYPKQMEFVRECLGNRQKTGSGGLRCLDAGCGTGEDTYSLAKLCMEAGCSTEEVRIEGWTLEPLELWAAAYRRFPHDRQREAAFRAETSQLFERGFQRCLRFRCADLTETDFIAPLPNSEAAGTHRFDLILCNGLLGGPIIHETGHLERVVTRLAGLLAPGGVLLAADSFHGGWKTRCLTNSLKAMFTRVGLSDFDAGEGIGGLAP